MRVLSSKGTAVRLDEKDRKILAELSADARIPLTALARKVKLSQDTVHYRVQRLREAEVLVGTLPVVDVGALGWQAYHLFLRVADTERALKAIAAHPSVRSVLEVYGAYDFEVAVIARSVAELDEILVSFNEYGVLDVMLVGVARILHSRVLPWAEPLQSKPSAQPDLDGKDWELLALLSEDGGRSLVSLAAATSLAVDTVRMRLKKLRGSVLQGFIPAINYAALGYSEHVMLLRLEGCNAADERTLQSLLHKLPQALWAAKTVGNANLVVYACTDREEELQRFIASLRAAFKGRLSLLQLLKAVSEPTYRYVPPVLFKPAAKRL